MAKRTKVIEASCPGNLLITGEYLILLPYGRGISMAPNRRMRARLVPRPAGEPWLLAGKEFWPNHGLDQSKNLLELMATASAPSMAGLPPAALEFDSTELYSSQDAARKLGLGSSAALAVCFMALLDSWDRIHGKVEGAGRPELNGGKWRKDLGHRALNLHRKAQGGKGSGYDVATSALGSLVAFWGGPEPQFELVHNPTVPLHWVLASGPQPVSSVSASASFLRWAEDRPGEATALLEQHNDMVDRWLGSHKPESWDDHWAEARLRGLELGELVGKRAQWAGARPLSSEWNWKASGAGNESYLGYSWVPSPAPENCEELSLDSRGVEVRWIEE